MYKHIVKCSDGDEFYIKLDTRREMEVFISLCKEMQRFIDETTSETYEGFEETWEGFKFRTTLECQVANDHTLELKKATGLDVLNILNKNRVVMVRYKPKNQEGST